MTWSLHKAESSLPLETLLPSSVLPFGFSWCCEPAADAHQSIHRWRWYRGGHFICTGTFLTMPLTNLYPGQHQNQAWCREMPQDMTEEDAEATCSHQQQAAHGSSITTENSPWFHVLTEPRLFWHPVQHSQVLSLCPRSLLPNQRKAEKAVFTARAQCQNQLSECSCSSECHHLHSS